MITVIKQKFLMKTAGVFLVSVYYDNRAIRPSSAILSVYMPSSSVRLIDSVTMTVGVDGAMSYFLTEKNNKIALKDYKAVILYVHNGNETSLTLFYDIVRRI